MGLRILQIGSSLFDWGGIERYVLYLADGLKARGHSVEIVCPSGSPLDERFHGRKHHLGLRGQFRFDKLPYFLRLFRTSRYDVVHVHFSPDFVIPALAARWTRQPLTIMSRHVVLPWSPSKAKRYMRLFDHIVAVCGATREKLLQSGVPDSFITVAHAGSPSLPQSEQSRSEAPGFKLGFFGRLVEEKGIRLLTEIAPRVPSVEIHVFGDGPLREELAKASPGNVHFHGFTESVPAAMAEVDAIIVPSIWEEAFPFSILEAMSLGKPVIASRVGGLPEMIEDGKTGVLFDRADSGAVVGAIEKLAADPLRRAGMARAARVRHSAEFTTERFAERIEAVYLDQIDRRRNR